MSRSGREWAEWGECGGRSAGVHCSTLTLHSLVPPCLRSCFALPGSRTKHSIHSYIFLSLHRRFALREASPSVDLLAQGVPPPAYRRTLSGSEHSTTDRGCSTGRAHRPTDRVEQSRTAPQSQSVCKMKSNTTHHRFTVIGGRNWTSCVWTMVVVMESAVRRTALLGGVGMCCEMLNN